MDIVTIAFLGLEGLLFVGALIVLVWLVFRRIRLKKEETFDKRDN
ncbi:MAG: hypothetical protein ACI9JN_001982 [Bacteroidia bacterium]|jgi:hypothetical protein